MGQKCGGVSLILLCIGIFTLSGCGRNNDSFIETENNDANEEIHTNITETEVKVVTEDNETIEPSESLPKPSEVPVNLRMEDILYHSTDDIDISLSIHRCKSDGENIYLVYGEAGEADLYIMPMGTNEHRQANIDNPEKMVICHIAIDTYGRIHLLVAGSNYDEWFIWRLNENFQIDKVMDISDYFAEHHYDLKEETSVYADYFKAAGNGYQVRCQIKNLDETILDLTLRTANREQAQAICANWKNQKDDVYALLMDQLLK